MDGITKSREELAAENDALRCALAEADAALAQAKAQNEYLAYKLEQLRQQIFGRKSEKLGPRDDGLVQLSFLPGEESPQREELREEQDAESQRKKRRNGRKPIPERFHRERVEIDVDPELRVCPDCAREMGCIGEEITEELEYVPALLWVIEYARKKYACKKCQNGVVTAALPPRPVKKGRPGPGLLAFVLASKYEDHLPLHRLERIFQRHGMAISRKTLCDWVGAMTKLLGPIVESMKRELLAKPLIQADETTVKVQDPGLQGGTRQGYLWTYGDPLGEVVYDFRMSRAAACPNEFLAGFKGYLQTDGYAGYDAICRSGEVVRFGCWAHVRRKFFAARKEKPEFSGPVLGAIWKLYRIEREAKDEGLRGEALVERRREQALPILKILRSVLEAEKPNRLPESGLGEAIGYALARWDDLERYVEASEVPIDNNAAERSLRGFVIGRKNWLFVGHPAAGDRASTMLSLIETCRRLGLNSLEYLRDVISRMAASPENAAELTPRRWREERARAAAATNEAARE